MEEKQTNIYQEFKEYVDTETGECIKGVLLSEEEIEKIRQTQEGKRKGKNIIEKRLHLSLIFNEILALSILIIIWNYGII